VLDCLVFDCDDTLYPRGSGLMQAISARISTYMIERMGMDPEIVPGLRREYWIEYGTTSRGLQILHEFDLEDYMHYVHDLPLEDFIRPNPALDDVLAALPQRKVIFTNATAEHARAVLEAVGVGHHFVPGYRRLLEALGEEGERCLFAEDSARNLRPAKELGMVTVLVDPRDRDVDGADYVIERIAEIGRVVKEVGFSLRR
jgi:putative hydrolase of the HAD superfamily